MYLMDKVRDSIYETCDRATDETKIYRAVDICLLQNPGLIYVLIPKRLTGASLHDEYFYFYYLKSFFYCKQLIN